MKPVVVSITTSLDGVPQSAESFDVESFGECRKRLATAVKELQSRGFKVSPVTRVDFVARKATAKGGKIVDLIEILYEARYANAKSNLVTNKPSYTVKAPKTAVAA